MSNFPITKQHDGMQCGLACLQMICRFYGKDYSLDSLSHFCFVTTLGISMQGLSEAASKIGFQTLCGRTTIEAFEQASLPCILYWSQSHFVVLYKIKRKKRKKLFYVADPNIGLLKYTENEFKEYWLSSLSKGEDKGIAMFLQPTPSFFERKDDKKKVNRSFGFLFNYFKQYRRYFWQIILGLGIGCVLQLIFPFLTQAIVDIGITHRDLHFIYLILAGQLILTISRTSVNFIRSWILLHISMRINISLVSDFFIKLLKLPMSFFDTKLLGDLMQRMGDHDRVEKFLTTQMLNVTFSLLSLFVFSIVLLSYNLLIFGVFLIGSICYTIWIAIFLDKRKQIDYLYFEKQAKNNNKTYQFLTSMQEIKLQDCEQRRRWDWEDVQVELLETDMKSLKLQQTQEAGSIFINEIKNIIITVLSATAVINGNMTLGMMLAVQYIIGQLNVPIEQLMSFIYSMQDVKISLERINEIHEKENEESHPNAFTTFQGMDKSLRLHQVDFKYDPHNPQKVLDQVEFQIPEGKVTAIVGTSGSGKTTIIKLLLGYYRVLGGEVFIGQTPLSHYNLKWWRRQCGVVMQDGVIFSESIARNIAVDDGDIDKDKLINAARMANIEDFILHLPLKYNTLIGQDGIGLSQGQKQRILIARAIYKNPQYIFLDEATNALDANNERTIVENLTKFYKGKTVIVVAHRLSTVRNADQIIVLNKGQIIEIGKHADLIGAQGTYYNLVKNQLELGT